MTVEPMIAVSDVERSSAWYCRLLGCVSTHGGPYFDRLTSPAGEVVILLHHWDAEEHPAMAGGRETGVVPGLELYFRVGSLEELHAIHQRAVELEATVLAEPAFREISHQHEVRIQDPDGYVLTPCWAPSEEIFAGAAQ